MKAPAHSSREAWGQGEGLARVMQLSVAGPDLPGLLRPPPPLCSPSRVPLFQRGRL